MNEFLKIWKIRRERPFDSCIVNINFDIGLLTWKANINIQPVFDYYKVSTYICSYLNKEEDECSQTMKQAFKESLKSGAGKWSYEQIKSVAYTYALKCERSLQEAVYQVMPELWLQNAFPGVLFANSNIPEKPIWMMLSKKELSKLPEYSPDVYKKKHGR